MAAHNGSNRRFGVTSNLSGLQQGIVVNSISHSDNTETAEARDEKGQLIDLAVYGENEEITVDGLTTGDGVKNGSVIWLQEPGKDAKGYLVTSTSKSENNTAFVTQNVTARYSKGCEYWTTTSAGVVCEPSATINSDVPSSDPNVPSSIYPGTTTP